MTARQANLLKHLLCVTNEHNSDNQMNNINKILWDCFTKIDIPCRNISCDLRQLNNNEFAKYHIDVWIESKKQWLTASRISHYKNYISNRMGIKESHVLDAVLDPYPIIMSIMEHNQKSDGTFSIPKCLKDHMI